MAEKKKEKKKGKGCLVVLGLFIGFTTLIGLFSNGGEKGKSTPSPTPVKTEEELEAEKQEKYLEIDEILDGYLAVINTSGMNEFVSTIEAKAPSYTDLEIAVKNVWHYQPKQVRLQAAQSLWELWAGKYCPERETPDHCRITLVDLKGNVVGGSSWLAGSIIKVDD